MQLSSGSEVLNSLLDGGYSSGMLNTIFGPAASGKTTACLLASIACIKSGKKVIFIDTENGFSVERLCQLTNNPKKILDNLILLQANSFDEQTKIINNLSDLASNPDVGLIVIDTIGKQYRLARKNNVAKINERLILQVDVLRDLYKQSECVFLMTNQVYSVLGPSKQIRPVGGEIIIRRSKCLIQFDILDNNKRIAILKKLPELKKEKSVCFEIKKKGFCTKFQ